MNPKSTCFHCGKKLVIGHSLKVIFQGTEVEIHKKCEEGHNEAWKPLTAVGSEYYTRLPISPGD